MAKTTILERALPAELRDKEIAKGRASFWEYCKQCNGKFFRDSRPHLKELCDTLQALIEGRLTAPNGEPCKRLAISEPPRHGTDRGVG